MKQMGVSARTQAALLISEVVNGHSLSGRLDNGLAKVRPDERPLCRELVSGTLREWHCLLGLISPLLKKPLRNKDGDVLALLAMGVYQLRHMKIPEHAAVSETVVTTHSLKKPWAKGLVNAVIRNYLRHHSTLHNKLETAAMHALPEWLYQQLIDQWPEYTAAIADASRRHPPMHLRVNIAKTSRDDALRQLGQSNTKGHAHPIVDGAIVLDAGADVADLAGFAQGLISVQDASAQLAAALLAPQSGEWVLDACAAPGGKAGHLAEWMGNDSTLVAADSSARRLIKIGENRDRIGAGFEIVKNDAREPSGTVAARRYDAILLDVPCSATGVLRRNPDVKLLRRATDIVQFTRLQKDLLKGIWPLLREGGRLLYATCSLLSAENDEIVRWALEHLTNAALVNTTHLMGTETAFGIQCLPQRELGDGLYYAMLQKRGT